MLHVEGLTKLLPDGRMLLGGISLDVLPGEFVGVLGPSGAGKSLTIRCLLGLLQPTSGTIRFQPGCGENFDMATARGRRLRRARCHMGTIFQGNNLVARLSVLENVMLGRLGRISTVRSWLRGFTNREAEQAFQVLCQLGMEALADRKAGSLSGGEAQRTAIARAVFQQPAIILADEPVSSLDPHNAQAVIQILARLADQTPVLGVFHQPELAIQYCSRIIGIRQGKIVYDGPPHLNTSELAKIYGGQLQSIKAFSSSDKPEASNGLPISLF